MPDGNPVIRNIRHDRQSTSDSTQTDSPQVNHNEFLAEVQNVRSSPDTDPLREP